jgi:transposase
MTDLYAGLGVSLALTNICIVDEDGRMVHESRVGSDPELIATVLQRIGDTFVRVGFEAGQLSQWLFFGLKKADLPAVCIEARHAKAAMVAMNRNKNDRNDARWIAHLIRSGWFKALHVKSVASQELRSLLVAREFFVNKLRDHENEIRGLLRPFGFKVGRVSASGFDARVRDLVDGNPQLELCIGALLDGRAAMMARLSVLHRELLRVTANDELCQRFMTIPGVGPVMALAFKTAIDDPARFRRPSDVGAHLGITPRQYQSGETDGRGRIRRSGGCVKADRPVHRGACDADPIMSMDVDQSVGREDRQAQHAEEGQDRGCAQTGCRHAPHVARRQSLPLGCASVGRAKL